MGKGDLNHVCGTIKKITLCSAGVASTDGQRGAQVTLSVVEALTVELTLESLLD